MDPEGLPQEQLRLCASLTDSLDSALPLLGSRRLMPAPECFAVLTEHPGHRVFDCIHGDWTVFLEMQGVKRFPESFSRLLDEIGLPARAGNDLGTVWNNHLESFSGSFFFVAINPETKLMVFANDALARLPVYVYRQRGRLFLGRDISLIRGAAEEISPDPLYLALSLMLAYVPGRGTPYREIDTLRGGTLAVYDWAKNDLRLKDQPELRFPEVDHSGSVKSRLPELVDFFHAKVRSSQGELPTLLSLSGGYDSRCVAASLLHQKIPFEACTYLDADKTVADEVLIAKQLAKLEGFSLQVLELNETCNVEHQTLFKIKGGLNYLASSFLIQYLNQVTAIHPEGCLLLTGDGGQVMKGLHLEHRLTTSKQWLDQLYEHEAIFSPKLCAEAFGIKEEDLNGYLLDLIAAYPADDYTDRYTSFILMERGARWLFEGEDRNRYFCRSEAPLYDYHFYRLAQRIPNSWKRDFALYSSFLHTLSPEFSRVRYAYRKWSPDRMRYPLYRALVTETRKLRKLVFRSKPASGGSGFIGREMMADKLLRQLENEKLKALVPGFARFSDIRYLNTLNHIQLGNLYTITSLMAGSA